MPDSLQVRGPHARSRINVNEGRELSDRSRELGVTPDDLRTAVEQEGPMVDRVRAGLAGRDESRRG